MKKTALIFAAALAFASAASAAPVKIGFAAEPYPPFTSPDASGKWVGWEIDIIDAVCKVAGAWANGGGAVSGGNAGIILGAAGIGAALINNEDNVPVGPLSTAVRHL